MEDPSIEAASAVEPYVVTRGKPPREYQFKAGQSGNPSGRPKGSKELRALLEEELERKVDATIGGQNVRLTKRKAMVKRLVDKAIQGDLKALLTIVRLEAQGAQRSDDTGGPGDEAACCEKDEEILRAYMERVTRGGGNALPS